MNNNKFFTLESEQRNRFYQVPKQFMNKNSKYFKMKADTKLIYGVLADRNSLSIKNGWHDDEGRIYFKFNQKELSEILGITPKTLRSKFEELEKFGLLFRVRLGVNQSDNLYLLQVDYEDLHVDTYEKKTRININNTKKESLITHDNSVEGIENTLMGKNYPSRRVKITHLDGKKLPTSDTYNNEPNFNDTNLTTTKENNSLNEVAIDIDIENSSSNNINLKIRNVTKTNIKKLKLNKEQIDLLEKYIKINDYKNLDGFSYHIAKEIKAGNITEKDLITSKKISKKNNKTGLSSWAEKDKQYYKDAAKEFEKEWFNELDY